MEQEYAPGKAPGRRAPATTRDGAAAPALPQQVGNRAFARMVQVQRAALTSQGAGPLDPEIASAIDAQRGGGAPLGDDVRTDMEHHLGADLSAVRVHTGSEANTLNRAVQAEAFTTGPDVFVSSDRYNPSSNDGRRLLAHELTHVVQQASGTAGGEGQVSHPGDASEVEAARVGDAVAASPRASDVGVSREPLEELGTAEGADVAREALDEEEEEMAV